MNEPIENLYFNWLCTKVHRVENPTPSLTYWKLFKELYETEFAWLISGDDNRAEDGRELRLEFQIESNIQGDNNWFESPCSVFEMLIAFSRRTEFAAGETPAFWFWHFLSNLGLGDANDASEITSEEIQDILNDFVWRNYSDTGQGGLFPMQNPPLDQRKVEIWYQFCEYLVDIDWPI